MQTARLRGSFGGSAGIHDLDEHGEPYCKCPYTTKEPVNVKSKCVDCLRVRVERLEKMKDEGAGI